MNTETQRLNHNLAFNAWSDMQLHQTCSQSSRTRIIGRLDCSTNKAPDMHWESSLGPLVASQKRPGVARLTYQGAVSQQSQQRTVHTVYSPELPDPMKEAPRGCSRVPRIKAACSQPANMSSSLVPRPICLQFNARSPPRPGIDCIWACIWA